MFYWIARYAALSIYSRVGLKFEAPFWKEQDAPPQEAFVEFENVSLFGSTLVKRHEPVFTPILKVQVKQERVPTDRFAVTNVDLLSRGLDYLILTIKAIMLRGIDDMQQGEQTGAYRLLQCAAWNPVHSHMVRAPDGRLATHDAHAGLLIWAQPARGTTSEELSQLEHFVIHVLKHPRPVNIEAYFQPDKAKDLRRFVVESPGNNDLANIAPFLTFVLQRDWLETTRYIEVTRRGTAAQLAALRRLQDSMREPKRILHQQLGQVVLAETRRLLGVQDWVEVQYLLGRTQAAKVKAVLDRPPAEVQRELVRLPRQVANALVDKVLVDLKTMNRLRDCLAHNSNNRHGVQLSQHNLSKAVRDMRLLKDRLVLIFCGDAQATGCVLKRAIPIIDEVEGLCTARGGGGGAYTLFRERQRKVQKAERKGGDALINVCEQTYKHLFALRVGWATLSAGEKKVIQTLTSVVRNVPRAAVVQKRGQKSGQNTAETAPSNPFADLWEEDEQEQEQQQQPEPGQQPQDAQDQQEPQHDQKQEQEQQNSGGSKESKSSTQKKKKKKKR